MDAPVRFILILILPSYVSSKCPEVNLTVQWPKTPPGDEAISTPICIDCKTKEIQKRMCQINGEWEPEPSCEIKQEQAWCPDGFFKNEILNICYVEIKNTTFPPLCPFKDTNISFDNYTVMLQEGVEYWMPVKRNLTNRVGLFQWTEQSNLYKSNFTGELDHSRVLGKDCVVFYNTSYRAAVPCNERHNAICAYSFLYHVSNSICNPNSNCRRSSYDANSPCFCLGSSDNSEKKAEILQNYQHTVYTSLTADNCSIGLTKIDGKYMWEKSNIEINYTNWSPNTIFDADHQYGAINSDGFWYLLTAEERKNVLCFLFEKDPKNHTPALNLSLDGDQPSFNLVVSYKESLKQSEEVPLVFCFTDSDSESLLYKYDSCLSDKYAINCTFPPLTDGPGNYWCEAFRYPDLEVIVSNTVFFPPELKCEFVAILEVTYGEINPLDPFIKDLLNDIFTQVTDYVPRVMKILDINEDDSVLTVNVHFSRQCKADTNIDDEFYQVRHIITSRSTIVLKYLRSALYCMNETDSDNVNWNKTEINQIQFSSTYFRRCKGNFVDGAYWSKVVPFEKSSVTDSLLKILQNETEPLQNLVNISKDFSHFKSFDVYLVGEIFGGLSKSEFNLNQTGEILSNLLNVEAEVFNQIQQSTGFTMLTIIDDLIAKFSGDFEQYLSENLALIVTYVNASGVVGVPDGTKTISSGAHIEDLISQDLTGTLLLTKQLETDFRIFITIFWKSGFFGQELNVFGGIYRIVRLDDPNFTFNGPIQILEKTDIKAHAVCSYYSQSSWTTIDNINLHSNYLICNYSGQSYFTIFSSGEFTTIDDDVRTTEDYENNVGPLTADLCSLLNSTDSNSVVMDQLFNISNKFDQFEPEDLYYVGQILKKISDDPDIDLQTLSDTVSNLHEIERNILRNSQELTNATDSILHYVDAIITNHEYDRHTEVVSENFMIVVSDVNETNISGLLVESSNRSSKIVTIFGDVNRDDVLFNYRIQSAVLLSPDLKTQMTSDSKVAFTVFKKDALFNEIESKYNYISNIFGILLPKILKHKGPITIIHRLQSNDLKECAYWNYDVVESVKGGWYRDQFGENGNSWTMCEFWHTTHFGLLLSPHDYIFDSFYLDLITTVNCGLSLLGLFIIILTAVCFKRWRSNTGNQILIHFDVAISLQIGTLYVSSSLHNRLEDDQLWCTVIGVVLHYAVISEFCWMFTIAVLQFKRFVEVLTRPPKYVVLKACLCGWILPLLPVGCVFFLDQQNYISGNVGLCYPSGLGLYLGVWLPLALIIIINFVIFFFIICNVCNRKAESFETGNNDMLFQWKLAILLFFMLGLTWTFGFLCELEFGLIFVYLFCFTATLQGFVMFMFFIVFNKSTRYLYYQSIKRCCFDQKY